MNCTLRNHVLALASICVVVEAFVGAAAHAAPDRSTMPVPGPVKPFTIVAPVELKLANGIRVFFIERKRAPVIDVVATVDAGGLDDPQDRYGLASFTAQMLTEGAGDRGAIAFADAQAAIAAQVYANADFDFATVGVHVGSAHFKDAAALVADALVRPRFEEADWARVQHNTFGYMTYIAQDPNTLANLAEARALWGPDHRRGTSLGGTPKTLVATTTVDLKAFHAAHFRPDTTTLIVVGDTDKATVHKVLDEAIGRWTVTGMTPTRASTKPPLVPTRRSVVAVNLPGAAQTILTMVAPIPSDTQRYSADVNVLNTLFGGSFSSRLNLNLREQHHYSYGAHSHFSIERSGGFLSAGAPVDTAHTGEALHEMLVELDAIIQPATVDEVARARNNMALSFPSGFGSGRALVGLWADVVSARIDPKRVERFVDETLKIDVAAVQAAAKRLINPDAVTVIAVGDLDVIGASLREKGPLTTITADDLLPGMAEAAASFGGPPG